MKTVPLAQGGGSTEYAGFPDQNGSFINGQVSCKQTMVTISLQWDIDKTVFSCNENFLLAMIRMHMCLEASKCCFHCAVQLHLEEEQDGVVRTPEAISVVCSDCTGSGCEGVLHLLLVDMGCTHPPGCLDGQKNSNNMVQPQNRTPGK